MLLQPLVENAIKYAVSPQEEGARITLSARVIGETLRITVEDTGPGLQGPQQGGLRELARRMGGQSASTGVGLANIRGRLRQAYGDNHRFETRSTPGGGFTVLIEIPFETAATGRESETSSSAAQALTRRSEERRGGKEGVGTCRSRL